MIETTVVFTLLIPIKRSFYDYIACKGEINLKFLLRHRKKQLQQFFLNVFIYLFFLHFLDCFFFIVCQFHFFIFGRMTAGGRVAQCFITQLFF